MKRWSYRFSWWNFFSLYFFYLSFFSSFI